MALSSFRVLPMNYMDSHWRVPRQGIAGRKLIKTMIPEAGLKSPLPLEARHGIGLIVCHVRAAHKG
jgi:hypothetical protein